MQQPVGEARDSKHAEPKGPPRKFANQNVVILQIRMATRFRHSAFSAFRSGRPVASFPSGLCFCGGVASIRRRTSSSFWSVSVMPVTYSDKSTSIRPYALSDEQHAAIGRLVRACAEIEDIINLRLAKLAQVPEGIVLVFLGRTSITNRLKILKLVSEGNGPQAEELFAQAFDNPDWRDIQEMRNTVAHGRLLGLTEDGNIAFSVVEPMGIDNVRVHMTVNAYNPEAFGILAHMAEDVIPQMEAAFGLKALREKRRQPTLAPHNMALPPEQRGSALARQRRASQASDKAAKNVRKDAQKRDPKNRKKKGQE